MNDHNPSDSDDQPTGPTERMTPGDPLEGGSEEQGPKAGDAPGAEPAGEPGEAPGAERPASDEPASTLHGGWIPPGGGYSPSTGSGREWSAPGSGVGGESGGAGSGGDPEWSPPAGGGPGLGGAPLGEDPTRPMAAASAPRRLRRSADDRLIAGVSGGLGRYFDVDPVLFRIAFVLLTFAGGAGLLAYLGLWLLTPSDGPRQSASQTGVRALAVIGGVVLLCVALPFLFVGAFLAIPLLPLAFVVLVVILLARGARGKSDGDTSELLARVALVLLVIMVSIAAFFAAGLGAAVGGGAVIAGVVIALGIGLIATAFLGDRGRGRWLVLPAVVLAAPLGLVAASGLDLRGGMGEREYKPTNLSALNDIPKLGAGEMRVDLRALQLPAGRTPLHLKVGAGHIVVYVPEDVCVSSRVKVGAGYAEVLDRDNGGFDVDWKNHRTPPAGVPTLDLDANIGLGAVEVRYNDEKRFGRFGRDGDRVRNLADACVAA
jgi:phage shock protein PspC (stress-responsive transcriptional regulator)